LIRLPINFHGTYLSPVINNINAYNLKNNLIPESTSINLRRNINVWNAGCNTFVRGIGDDTPTIDSVSVVRDFPNVFPANLSGMPPDRDIDFGIDLVQGTQPISIPLYRMALA